MFYKSIKMLELYNEDPVMSCNFRHLELSTKKFKFNFIEFNISKLGKRILDIFKLGILLHIFDTGMHEQAFKKQVRYQSNNKWLINK